MTKIYEGAGEYTVHLESGRVVMLNEAELEEIAGYKVTREEYNLQVLAISDIADELEDVCPGIKEMKETINYIDSTNLDDAQKSAHKSVLTEIQTITDHLDTVRETIQVAVRQSSSV
jgi:hypothetical protein